MLPRRLLLSLACCAAILVPLAGPPRLAGAARSSYFAATGHNVADPFLRFFGERGGVPIFGLPLTESFVDGDLTVQYFERARLEYHLDYPPGQQIQAGQLGRELTVGRADEPPFVPVAAATAAVAGAPYFPETGHTLRGVFGDRWRRAGGLPAFGYPISEEFTELDLAGGGPLLVQYFERARFEYHPERAGTSDAVQLTLLGARDFTRRGLPRSLLAPVSTAPPPQPRALMIPVLEYHDVGYGVGTYQVTLPAFVQQLDWLQSHGYTTVTLGQVYEYLFEGGDLPARPVVLTFDDGRASQWNAVQQLNARGMTGVFFVMGGGTALGDAQLRQMVAAGHEIEAHSMTHPQLSRLSDAQLAYEVAGSKRALEARLGVPIRYFAYPYGDYNPRVIDAVAAAGYQGALAAWGGAGWTPARRFNEPRILVSGYATIGDFARLLP